MEGPGDLLEGLLGGQLGGGRGRAREWGGGQPEEVLRAKT